MAENKQNLEVTILTPELRFAVMNKTHVTARSMQASGTLNYEAAAAMQVSEDNENSYELVRAIADALAEVKVELGEYLNEENTTADNMIPTTVEAEPFEPFSPTEVYSIGDKVTYDNKFWKFTSAHSEGAWNSSQVQEVPIPDDRVVYDFKLPSNFNSAAADALGAGIHEFVVGRTIYAWYRQTVPALAEACRVDAEAALDRVKKALYKRKRPDRPYQS